MLSTLSTPADSLSEDPSRESLLPLEWLSTGSYWYGSTVASDPESNGKNSRETQFTFTFRATQTVSAIAVIVAFPTAQVFCHQPGPIASPLVTSRITTPISGCLSLVLLFKAPLPVIAPISTNKTSCILYSIFFIFHVSLPLKNPGNLFTV